jgi:hypothetical protein
MARVKQTIWSFKNVNIDNAWIVEVRDCLIDDYIFCIIVLSNPYFISVMLERRLIIVIPEAGDFCNNQLCRLVGRSRMEGHSMNMEKMQCWAC